MRDFFPSGGGGGAWGLDGFAGQKIRASFQHPENKRKSFLKSANDRAQTWHNPADVKEALQRSLNDLQLDYGTLRFCQIFLSLPYSHSFPKPPTPESRPEKDKCEFIYITTLLMLDFTS